MFEQRLTSRNRFFSISFLISFISCLLFLIVLFFGISNTYYLDKINYNNLLSFLVKWGWNRITLICIYVFILITHQSFLFSPLLLLTVRINFNRNRKEQRERNVSIRFEWLMQTWLWFDSEWFDWRFEAELKNMRGMNGNVKSSVMITTKWNKSNKSTIVTNTKPNCPAMVIDSFGFIFCNLISFCASFLLFFSQQLVEPKRKWFRSVDDSDQMRG